MLCAAASWREANVGPGEVEMGLLHHSQGGIF
jgi:hypothetical protein